MPGYYNLVTKGKQIYLKNPKSRVILRAVQRAVLFLGFSSWYVGDGR